MFTNFKKEVMTDFKKKMLEKREEVLSQGQTIAKWMNTVITGSEKHSMQLEQ